MIDKATLRKQMRSARREHADSIPETVRALLFKRPPAPLLAMIPEGAVIGLYHAAQHEAPSHGYARFFSEENFTIALPRFEGPDSTMQFATHTDPFGDTDLEKGDYGLMQPAADATALIPDVLFVPLLAFDERGARLGQGGGHYDRWLADHPGTMAIGLGWDCQLVDTVPTENHDMPLAAIVTPTRLYGPF